MAIYRNGADPVALRAAGVRFEALAREFAGVRATVEQTTAAALTHWAGADGARFTDRWRASAPAMHALEQALGSLGHIMRRNADAQDAASAGSSGSTASAASPSAGVVPAMFTGPGPKDPPVDGYRLGPPSPPNIPHDEDFIYGSKSATPGDYVAAAKWKAMLAGGRTVRSDLDDATAMYAHYWDNNGAPQRFDYDEACREDSAVAKNVDDEIRRTAAAVDRYAGSGDGSFSLTGEAHPSTAYPKTENWQKAIGAYHQWSSADVTVQGGMVTMRITVHAEDYYNFNRNASDIATGAGDNENGRFTEIGWAKPFPSSGEVTREVTWPVGHPPGHVDVGPGVEERNPGREDRVDERDNPRPNRMPDNNRGTGPVILP